MSNNIVKNFGSKVEFVEFGRNALAYVRPISSDDLMQRFPETVGLPAGVDMWGLFGADGKPLAVADEPEILASNAEELDLLPLSLQ